MNDGAYEIYVRSSLMAEKYPMFFEPPSTNACMSELGEEEGCVLGCV